MVRKSIKICPVIPLAMEEKSKEEGFDPVELLAPEWKENRLNIINKAKHASHLEERIDAILLIGSLAAASDQLAMNTLLSILNDPFEDEMIQDFAQDAVDVLKMRQ